MEMNLATRLPMISAAVTFARLLAAGFVLLIVVLQNNRHNGTQNETDIMNTKSFGENDGMWPSTFPSVLTKFPSRNR